MKKAFDITGANLPRPFGLRTGLAGWCFLSLKKSHSSTGKILPLWKVRGNQASAKPGPKYRACTARERCASLRRQEGLSHPEPARACCQRIVCDFRDQAPERSLIIHYGNDIIRPR